MDMGRLSDLEFCGLMRLLTLGRAARQQRPPQFTPKGG
jgi:hypothetical protein